MTSLVCVVVASLFFAAFVNVKRKYKETSRTMFVVVARPCLESRANVFKIPSEILSEIGVLFPSTIHLLPALCKGEFKHF